MSDYRLLIADSDEAYAGYLVRCLSEKRNLKVVGSAQDGLRALRMIQTSKPDIILMDTLLPELDGISVMKEIQKMKYSPVIICISQFHTSMSIEMARRNGACYYVYKSVDPDSLAAILVECADMARENRRNDQADKEMARCSEIRRRIHDTLCDMGFSSKHNGSSYIAESIELALESPLVLHNMSSGLYRKLAAKSKVSVSSIERSIRTAIASADADGRLSKAIGSAPTNKTCIRYILKTMNLQ